MKQNPERPRSENNTLIDPNILLILIPGNKTEQKDKHKRNSNHQLRLEWNCWFGFSHIFCASSLGRPCRGGSSGKRSQPETKRISWRCGCGFANHQLYPNCWPGASVVLLAPYGRGARCPACGGAWVFFWAQFFWDRCLLPEAAAEVLGAAAALRDVRQSPPGYVARRTGRSVPRFWMQMRGGSRVGMAG